MLPFPVRPQDFHFFRQCWSWTVNRSLSGQTATPPHPPRSTYVCRLLPMPGNSWSWMWNSFSMSIFISLLGYSPLAPLPTASGPAPLHASAMQLLLGEGREVGGARGFPGAMLRIHTSDTICLPKNQDNNYNGTGSRRGRSRRGVQRLEAEKSKRER